VVLTSHRGLAPNGRDATAGCPIAALRMESPRPRTRSSWARPTARTSACRRSGVGAAMWTLVFKNSKHRKACAQPRMLMDERICAAAFSSCQVCVPWFSDGARYACKSHRQSQLRPVSEVYGLQNTTPELSRSLWYRRRCCCVDVCTVHRSYSGQQCELGRLSGACRTAQQSRGCRLHFANRRVDHVLPIPGSIRFHERAVHRKYYRGNELRNSSAAGAGCFSSHPRRMCRATATCHRSSVGRYVDPCRRTDQACVALMQGVSRQRHNSTANEI